ncbi:hypothetical protein WA026_022089 [Henosepilachna vigintioctopunctata]|uniref:NADH dehydrogenase [ubiquinone] 1 alpha subcomplex subunit 7 n=1 Tax=Henosepilachna vigintioctopunctata TaxID=420089 RepID=A0AAW1U628_9CUCU
MSKARIQIRNVSPFLQRIRDLLLGRNHTLALRFDPDVATRNPPLPDLPDGPSHRLNANYYYTRDARSEVTHPYVVAYATGPKLLQGNPSGDISTKNVQPGKIWQWDQKF